MVKRPTIIAEHHATQPTYQNDPPRSSNSTVRREEVRVFAWSGSALAYVVPLTAETLFLLKLSVVRQPHSRATKLLVVLDLICCLPAWPSWRTTSLQKPPEF